MIPEELLKLFTAQGFGWVMFALSVFVGGKLLTMIMASNNELMALQEKRVAEARQSLEVLHQSSQANEKIASVMDERTQVLQSVSALVTQMDRTTLTDREHFRTRLTQIELVLGNIQKEVTKQ